MPPSGAFLLSPPPAVTSSKLQTQLEAAFGPAPINPAADLCGIASVIYTRMHALAVEQERLRIQYETCIKAIDRFTPQ